MALVIEDGTGKNNSTSYITVEEFRAYASARGADLPADDPSCEQLLIQAMDYLEQYTSDTGSPGRYKGVKMYTTQALQWPRTGAVIDGVLFPSNQIPNQLKSAQAQLGIEATSFELMPSNNGYSVAREKVDVLEVEYATGGRLSGSTRDPAPSMPKVDALLRPLLVAISSQPRTLRI